MQQWKSEKIAPVSSHGKVMVHGRFQLFIDEVMTKIFHAIHPRCIHVPCVLPDRSSTVFSSIIHAGGPDDDDCWTFSSDQQFSPFLLLFITECEWKIGWDCGRVLAEWRQPSACLLFMHEFAYKCKEVNRSPAAWWQMEEANNNLLDARLPPGTLAISHSHTAQV